MSVPSSTWCHPPDAPLSCRALVRAARHRLSTFRGLGDLLAWVLAGVGIEAPGACGCNRRQKWLNRMVPFRFVGKSMFDRRGPIRVSAVLVNRLGASLRGRIQVHSSHAEPAIVEFAELADGATATLFDAWTTDRRTRDGWSWMLEDAAGHVYTGYVVCAVEGRVEIEIEAAPRPRLSLRQAHGACVVDLDAG